MAFPTIPTTGGGTLAFVNQLNTTATLTGPNLNTLTFAAGDLLIAIASEYQSNAGADAAFTSWAGGGLTWTEIRDSTGTTVNRMGVAYTRAATGSETGTVTVTRSGTLVGDASMIVMVIPGAHPTTAPEATAVATASNAGADPASLDPSGWGAEDTLWISASCSGMTAATGSWTGNVSAPTNYTNYFETAPTDTSTIGDSGLAVAFRQLNASSENTGTFTVDTSNNRSAAVTIAVRPAPDLPYFGPTWAANGTASGIATAESSTCTLPAGVLKDDIALIQLHYATALARTVTPPSGFVEKISGSASTGTTQHLFWKRMSGGETGTLTSDWTGQGSVTVESQVAIIRGARPFGDPFSQIALAGTNGTTTSTPAVSLANSVPADELLVWSTSANSFINLTTPPAGYTTQQDLSGLVSASKNQTTAGTTGSVSGTVNSAQHQVSILASILPDTPYPIADASSPPIVKLTQAAAVSTASFTPPANSVIVVGYTSDGAGGGANTITDNTGGALTWTEHANRRLGTPTLADEGRAAVWTAKVASSPGAMTVTCDNAEAGSMPQMLIVRVYAGTDVDIDDPIGGLVQGPVATSSTTIQASVTPETTGGGLRLLYLDWNATGIPTSFLPDNTTTVLVDALHAGGGSTNVQIAKTTPTAAGVAETIGATLLAQSSVGNYIAYELRKAPAAVTITAASVASSATAPAYLVRNIGPIAAYPFDEGSGLVTADASGNGRDLTAAHTTDSWNSSGHTDDAIHNTGASGGASGVMGTNTSLSAWSVAFWMRREGTWAASGWASPFGEGGGSGDWYVELQSSGYQIAFWGNSTGQSSGVAANLDTWYHVAVVRSGTTTQMYIDGVAQGSPSTNAAHNFGANPHIVAGFPTNQSNVWNGSVDDLRIFNYALNLSEINYYKDTPVEATSVPGVTLTAASVASSAIAMDDVTVNINLTAASTASSAIAVDPTADRTISAASVASSAVALTIQPKITLTPAAVASSGVAADPDAIRTITAASVASSAIPLTLTPTAVLATASVASSAVVVDPDAIITISPASTASSAVAVDPDAIITISPAVVASSAVAVDADRILLITPAATASVAVALTITPVVSLTPAVAASSAVSVDPDRIVTLSPATVAASAVAPVYTPYAVLTPAVAATSAVAVDPDTNVTLTPATVASSAVATDPTAVITISPAVVASSAVAVDPDPITSISPATVASSAVAVSVSAIVQLAPVSVASSAVAPVYTPVVSLTPANTTSIARLLTLSGTAISAPASVASSAVALMLTPVVSLTPAVVASSAIAPVYTPVVSLTPATTSATPVAPIFVQIVVLTPAVVAAVAHAATAVPEVDLTPAVVASSAVAPVYTPYAVLAPASAASSAVAVDPTAVITIDPAVTASSAVSIDPTAIITISPASTFATAVPIDPTAVITIAPAVVSATAPAVVFTPVIQLAVVSVASSAIAPVYTPYAVLTAAVVNSSARTLIYSGSVTLTPASVASSAVAPVYTSNVNLTPASVSAVAVVLSYSAFGTVSLTPAVSSAQAVAPTLVQTVVLTPAVVASSAVATSPAGVGAVTLTPAATAASAVAPTVTPVISLSAASVASSARTLTLTPVVALTPATVASSARTLTLTPVVSLTPAAVASSARPLTLVQTVVLTPALASAVAAVLSFGGVGSLSLIPASVASSAEVLTVIPVVQLNAAGVVSSALPVTLSPIVVLSPATASTEAAALVFVPVVQLNAAGATFTAVPVSVGQAVTLTAAGTTISAVALTFPGDRSPGKTYVVLSGVEMPLLLKAAKDGVLVDSGWLGVSS